MDALGGSIELFDQSSQPPRRGAAPPARSFPPALGRTPQRARAPSHAPRQVASRRRDRIDPGRTRKQPEENILRNVRGVLGVPQDPVRHLPDELVMLAHNGSKPPPAGTAQVVEQWITRRHDFILVGVPS